MEEGLEYMSDDKATSLPDSFFDDSINSTCQAAQYSPLALAYLGDSVYELLIRSKIVSEANMQVNKLNRKGSQLAMAKTQALMVSALTELFDDDEKRFIQRGKNAKVVNIPKSCTAHEYHVATGFECLLGYLYLSGNHKRAIELVNAGWRLIEQEKI